MRLCFRNQSWSRSYCSWLEFDLHWF